MPLALLSLPFLFVVADAMASAPPSVPPLEFPETNILTRANRNHRVITSAGLQYCQSTIRKGGSSTFGVFDRSMSERDILRGFKANTNEGEDPFRQKVFKAERVLSPTKYSYTYTCLMEDIYDFVEAIDVSGNATLSFFIPIASVTGQLSFIQKRSSTSYKKTFMFETRRIAYTKTIDVNTIEYLDRAKGLDSSELADVYGTKFVESVHFGAELLIYYTITSTEEIFVEMLKGTVTVKIGICPFCLTFSIDFGGGYDEPVSNDIQIHYEVEVKGVDLLPPTNPSYNQVIDFIHKFNEKYDQKYNASQSVQNVENDTNNLLNRFSPIAFSLGSIFSHGDTKFTSSEMATFDQSIIEVNNVISLSLLWKSRILLTRDSLESLYAEGQERNEIYIPYKRAADNMISRLDAKIEECLQYKKLPFSVLSGRDGSTLISIPEEYPTRGSRGMAEMNGLLGKAYIPSPLTLGATTFDDLHYVGFARLQSDKQMEPWINGSVRKDKDNEVIGIPDTPEKLEVSAYAWKHDIPDNNATLNQIRYDKVIYVQLNAGGKLWLSSRENIENVTTKTTADDLEAIWTLRSHASTSSDPKAGQCLKYGDSVFLQKGFFVQQNNTNYIQGWLGYDDTKKNAALLPPDFGGKPEGQARWLVRSFPRSFESPNSHTKVRQCVQANGNVYLQNQIHQSMWLLGGYGNVNKEVLASEMVTSRIQNYQWTLKYKKDGPDGVDCEAVPGEAVGEWVHLPQRFETEHDHTIEYERGIVGREGYIFHQWEQISAWKKSVYTSISAGLDFRESSSSTGKPKERSANHIHGTKLARSIETAGDLTNASMQQLDNAQLIGTAWQFLLSISDMCVPSWKLKTGYISFTDSLLEPPCCLPGLELDPEVPHGPCRLNSPCNCDFEICNPPLPPTMQPTRLPTNSFLPEADESSSANKGPFLNSWILGLGSIVITFQTLY